MNGLICMKKEIKMTSLEISELTGKMHQHILRDIKDEIQKLENGGVKGQSIFGESSYINSQNKSQPMYELTKEGVLQLALRYDAVIRFKLIQIATEKSQIQVPSYQIEDPIERAQVWIKEYEERQKLQLENEENQRLLDEAKPKISYYDLVLQCDKLIPITIIAKDFGISGIKLNQILKELNVQYKMGKMWLLYQKYADKCYTKSKTTLLENKKTALNTHWTQKGRLFIYNLLKNKKGILPIIERAEENYDEELYEEDFYNDDFDD